MKKLNLWLFASLFVAALTLSACGGSDDEPTNNRLSGKWKYTKSLADGDKDVYTLTFGSDNSYTLVKELWNGEVLHVRWIYKGNYIATDAEATITVNQILGQNPEDPAPWATSYTQAPFKVEYRIDGNKLYLVGNVIPEGPYIKH